MWTGITAHGTCVLWHRKTEQELAELCGTDPDLGTSPEQMQETAKTLGMQVEIHDNSTFEDMQTWLAKGVPVTVAWFTRGRVDYDESEVSDGHYSVVVGLDEECIYLQDPEIGHLRTFARDDFMRVWFDFRNETIDSWENIIIRQMIVTYK